MIQGGGLTVDMKKKDNSLKLKMRQTMDSKMKSEPLPPEQNSVNSATSQFFINVKDNNFLNHRGKNPRDYGYTVFGKVIEGMTVVNKIKTAATTTKDGRQNVPMDPIIIKKVRKGFKKN